MPDARSRSRALDRQALGVFLLFLLLSCGFFGRGLIGGFSSHYIGRGPDSYQLIWYLGWWKFALTQRINPFVTGLLFAPAGVSLAWTTFVPLASLLALPVTWSLGAVASSNAICLLTPALAGWAAFVLCRWITGSCWASILAGWVFAFSPYVVSAILTHFNVGLVFPAPLAVWLTLRALAGEVGPRRFVVGLALLIAAQFLLFAELVASATVAGAAAYLLALAFADSAVRRRLWRLLPQIGASYAIAAIIISPQLYYMFHFDRAAGSVLDPTLLGADLLSFVIPTTVNELGRLTIARVVSTTYMATLSETSSYIALPLIAIVILFGKAHWREPAGRMLIELLIVLCVLSVGARVVVAGHPTVAAPWTLLLKLPLVDKIVPIRMMAYASLVLAVIVAIWLSSPSVRPWHKWALGLTVVPFMLPNLSARFWVQRLDLPPFFSSGLYRQYLAPDEIVMALPNPIYGDGMRWQLATDMYFRLAGGYIGLSPLAPPDYAGWPIMAALYDVAGVPDAADQLKALLAHDQVAAIIVGPRKYWMTKGENGRPTATTWVRTPPSEPDRAALHDLLATLGVPPLEVGGVTLYRLTPAALAPYLKMSALEMQQRYARTRFETLLGVAQAYIAGGGDLNALNDRKYEALESAPRWFGGPAFPRLNPNKMFQVQWTLGRWHPGLVAVGVEGSYEALRPLIAQYGPDSAAVYFPFPQKLDTPAPDKSPDGAGAPALMVMEFTPAALASAAARVARPGVPP